MRQIIIEIDGPEGKFNVREGDKHTKGCSWDEMIGQVASMTIPDFIVWRGTYPMLTDAEWEARKIAQRQP